MTIDRIDDVHTEVPVPEEGTLEQQKVRVEAKIAVAKAKDKGLDLDAELMEKLYGLGDKLDKGRLSVLIELKKAGMNPNAHLQSLVEQRTANPLADEKRVKRFGTQANNLIELLDIFRKRPDLRGYIKTDLLNELAGKIAGLTAE
jgi:hypothetical protein